MNLSSLTAEKVALADQQREDWVQSDKNEALWRSHQFEYSYERSLACLTALTYGKHKPFRK